MRRQTYSFLFYVKRTRALKNGELPVFGRITVNGQRSEFSCQISVIESEWDSVKGCARGFGKKARSLNDKLDIIRMKIRDCKNEFESKDELYTANDLKDSYLGVNKKITTLLELFDEHNEQLSGLVGRGFAPATLVKYQSTRKHLAEFIETKYKRTDIPLHEVSQMFVKNFEYFLKVTKNCANNTTVKYLKNLKKVINIGRANELIQHDPFANVRFQWEESDPAFLTEEELTHLMTKKLEIERISTIRDIYVFCCFTGLAFIDVQNLKKSDIIEQNGQLWIKKKRQKTKNVCSIPLLEPALRIIEKYMHLSENKQTEKLLPVTSNQKMNAYLKEIACICNIDKHLTTHTARHTFATTVTLANQVSIEVVSKMLGHSSINMTKRYARVVDDLINKDMQKLYGKYACV
jgi:site-specific recombinase XerD